MTNITIKKVNILPSLSTEHNIAQFCLRTAYSFK